MELLGWLANVFFFTGGLCKNPRMTMCNYIVADILFIIMYVSMELYSAAISMTIVTLRCIFALFLSPEHNKISVILLTTLACVIITLKMQSFADIYVIFAGVFIAISQLNRDNFNVFRFSNTMSQILWIAHSLTFGVYPMIASCMLILATDFYAVWRYSSFRSMLTDLTTYFAFPILRPAKVQIRE